MGHASSKLTTRLRELSLSKILSRNLQWFDQPGRSMPNLLFLLRVDTEKATHVSCPRLRVFANKRFLH